MWNRNCHIFASNWMAANGRNSCIFFPAFYSHFLSMQNGFWEQSPIPDPGYPAPGPQSPVSDPRSQSCHQSGCPAHCFNDGFVQLICKFPAAFTLAEFFFRSPLLFLLGRPSWFGHILLPMAAHLFAFVLLPLRHVLRPPPAARPAPLPLCRHRAYYALHILHFYLKDGDGDPKEEKLRTPQKS